MDWTKASRHHKNCIINVLHIVLQSHDSIKHVKLANETQCNAVMVALWNRTHHYIFNLSFVMAAVHSRCGHYIFVL